MKHITLILFLTAAFLSSHAQTEQYIEVNGSAEMEIIPNIIVIQVRLREYDENKEKISLEKIDRSFMNAVSKSNIKKGNVSLAEVTLNAEQRRRERDFYAQKSYEIIFSSGDELMKFIENLEDVKINFMNIVRLSHTEIEKYRLETKIVALKAAEQKADALLRSVGAKKGKIIMIKEDPAEVFDWRPNSDGVSLSSNLMAYQNVPQEESTPFRKIKLRFEIQARFAIE